MILLFLDFVLSLLLRVLSLPGELVTERDEAKNHIRKESQGRGPGPSNTT